jgi:dTMP kinase
VADRSDSASARAPFDESALAGQNDLRGVLAIKPFRHLWMALAASSLGNWLGLLALTALAAALAKDAGGDFAAMNYAIGGVLLLKLLPALLLGPFAGVVADRLNRRWTMVTGDIIRAGLTLSIPFVREMWWLMVATVLIEAAALFWMPAKEATIPNLVPRERLEAANQLNLLGTYGSAPIASALFAGLSLATAALTQIPGLGSIDALTVALCVNALTFLVSGISIARIRGIPERAERTSGEAPRGLWSTLIEGWRYVGTNKTIRGLVFGIIGAFAAGGVVIGLAKTYVIDLGAGDPGYGLLVGCVFTGLAIGMLVAPRLLEGFSRRRLFGLSIVGVGTLLLALGIIQNIVIVSMLSLVLGCFAGMAWVTGYTLLGLQVADEVRGRTFAFVQNSVQLTLIGVLAAGPFIAGTIGSHSFELNEGVTLTYSGAAAAMLLAGLLALLVGLVSYRTMDDRKGIPLGRDLLAALRGELEDESAPSRGLFLAFEGGEGAGKSTQARLLAEWLQEQGRDVVLTHEPGATSIGQALRGLLLEHLAEPPTPRAEALLYAADRAQHVDTVIRPALARGADVITDRYVDSSIAYQAAGRELATVDIARLSTWATRRLRPDLTILLDVAPDQGLARFEEAPDRLESESTEFHERVRSAFRTQARRTPDRYLVLDAHLPVDVISWLVRERLRPMLETNPPAIPSELRPEPGIDLDALPGASVERADSVDGLPGEAVEAVAESLVTPDGPRVR